MLLKPSKTFGEQNPYGTPTIGTTTSTATSQAGISCGSSCQAAVVAGVAWAGVGVVAFFTGPLAIILVPGATMATAYDLTTPNPTLGGAASAWLEGEEAFFEGYFSGGG
jgi:hypothetical protein